MLQLSTISLLSVVSKLLQRHIHQSITQLEVYPLLNKQWGGGGGGGHRKSTVTALLAVVHVVQDAGIWS